MHKISKAQLLLQEENILKSQLGPCWHHLNPNIQKRFDREPEVGGTFVYTGIMSEMRRSFMGWLFATLTYVIGNPLSPHQGRDIPMEVILSKKDGRPGVFWQRTYFLPGSKPFIVVSSKQRGADGKMMECVGGGFGMILRVSAEEGSLHFRSEHYFWRICGRRILLPRWLSPGEAHVVHADLGGGDFSFTISMRHPVLGETFYQTGVFREKSEVRPASPPSGKRQSQAPRTRATPEKTIS